MPAQPNIQPNKLWHEQKIAKAITEEKRKYIGTELRNVTDMTDTYIRVQILAGWGNKFEGNRQFSKNKPFSKIMFINNLNVIKLATVVLQNDHFPPLCS